MSKNRPWGDANLEPVDRLNNRRVTLLETDVLKKIVDDQGLGTIYIGNAQCTTPTTQAKWQIQRIVTAAGITTIEWADGNGYYDNVWDDRAILTYR
jgi:hypothetical protein